MVAEGLRRSAFLIEAVLSVGWDGTGGEGRVIYHKLIENFA